MICCDAEGRLNEKSVILQSSIEHSGGECVRLDLQRLNHYSIFPGQASNVVGIGGHNPSGHCFIASKLVDSIPIISVADENLNPLKKQAIDKESQSTDTIYKQRELSMIIAAGPFTTTDNLLFEPLTELLQYAKRRPPQLLVLVSSRGTTVGTFPAPRASVQTEQLPVLFSGESLRETLRELLLDETKSTPLGRSLLNPERTNLRWLLASILAIPPGCTDVVATQNSYSPDSRSSIRILIELWMK
ncbi:hypothetical protein LR48_Vigan233s000100 [Vigna angularis]|uniref:DNA polymerase alpha subunit B OB domain-containing protein n=1 Tax=Phaseolus angularis TaxID=3914 RepID=A0A0L9T7S4_PHAAN|nr:hypothetical protein LR48_Vigan233s000100 [Vigna angularis]